MLKWAAISDTPPFTETTEFEFDEQVNVFIGPNATGKSTLLRELAGGQDDFDGDGRPRFAFDVAVEKLYRAQANPLMEDLLDESGEFDQEKWDRLGIAPGEVLEQLPLIYLPASRINIPLSGDVSAIQEVRKRKSEEQDLSEILAEPPSWDVFNGADVYHAARVINEGLVSGQYSRLRRGEMVRVSSLPYECAQSICAEALGEDDRQQDWIQYMPVELRGREDFSVATVHYDMAVSTPQEPDDTVFMGDLSSGTQGTLLWIWYLALRIANHYKFRVPTRLRPDIERWEKRPAILLIDEIENHLHPSWQRRVIPALLKYFPGLQIFATTHSPFVIAGLKAGQVHLLSRNDDGTVVASTNEQDIVGWTADEILRTFMGVDDPTDEMTAANAAKLRVLRRKEALEGLDEREQAELDELRTKAGADILAQGGMLNAQRERFADMVQDFLKARLADTPPNEGQV